ncbi:echinoderm microtubule-associated protein-like CG42247 isoform X2 [Uranotaenia lowii]|uniref:echinoderm microtubule-associated protein-like CG42247 isoform X2 n=1 Tax=Uranotaenia lowii TaxID=190385 RepID=UPI00247AD1A2|nr:echinoderm microtubule-associated protein-like CG42247 isoform X2 [Uranotaenia lowii]
MNPASSSALQLASIVRNWKMHQQQQQLQQHQQLPQFDPTSNGTSRHREVKQRKLSSPSEETTVSSSEYYDDDDEDHPGDYRHEDVHQEPPGLLVGHQVDTSGYQVAAAAPPAYIPIRTYQSNVNKYLLRNSASRFGPQQHHFQAPDSPSRFLGARSGLHSAYGGGGGGNGYLDLGRPSAEHWLSGGGGGGYRDLVSTAREPRRRESFHAGNFAMMSSEIGADAERVALPRTPPNPTGGGGADGGNFTHTSALGIGAAGSGENHRPSSRGGLQTSTPSNGVFGAPVSVTSGGNINGPSGQQQAANAINNNNNSHINGGQQKEANESEPSSSGGPPGPPALPPKPRPLIKSKESVSPLPLKRAGSVKPTTPTNQRSIGDANGNGAASPTLVDGDSPVAVTSPADATNTAGGLSRNPNVPTRPIAGVPKARGKAGGGWKARGGDFDSYNNNYQSPTDDDESAAGQINRNVNPVITSNVVVNRNKIGSSGGGAIGGGGRGGWGANARRQTVATSSGSRVQSPSAAAAGGAIANGIAAGDNPGSEQLPLKPQTPTGGGDPSRIDLSFENIPGPSGLLPHNPGVPGTIGGNPQSRYSNLSFWKARRVLFYRNGDPFFPGVEFRFKPGRDICTLEALLDKLSARMDLPRGARYIFSMDGDRKYSLEELEDGSSYVVSSFKVFKPASYGKKNGIWYASPGNQGWGGGAAGAAGGGGSRLSRKPSVTEVDNMPSGSLKPSAGRVIRIINSHDHSVQCRVLLNLRTSQPFEEVLEDLGQVLKMLSARKMYTASGQEVRSFSQLRNEFAEVDTFYLCSTPTLPVGALGPGVPPSPRRSRSRLGGSVPDDLGKTARQRARSKSRPRVLYAPENELVRASSDYPLLDSLKEEPTRITIRGLRRTFYPPMHHPPVDNSPPDKKLSLFWVHGYRGIDSKRNLWVLPSGELLYYVAAVAILYDREEEAQRHYTGHTEDIMCMEVHPSRELVGSGQRAGRDRKSQAHVRIWSTESLQTLYVFGMGELDSGVLAVAFSQLNGGSYILAVDAGRESILSVWQWQWGHLLGKVATLQEGIWGATFHPLDDNLLITHGKGHLAFWHRRKDGFFEKTDIIKPPARTFVTCVQFEPDGDVITADSDGFITIYSVDADGAYFVRMEFEAHSKAIACLVMLSEGTLISGGEKDRKIAAWDSLQNYKRITDIKLPESAGGVRTIYPQRPGRNDGNIYVGTTRNNILEGSLQRRFNQVIFGHGKQLWAMAAHPNDEVFATGGHDKYVALWRRHKLIWTSSVGYEIISLAFHPYGAALAAGSSEGHLVVINAENGATMLTIRVCGSPLNCVEFNTVGDMIAIGSQNGSIYLFRVSRDGFSFKKINKIRGSQPLTHLDWSSEGNFLQSTTVDFDLLFWDVKSLSPEKSPIAMKDVKWSTNNSTVGFLVAGMWNNRYYATPANTIISTASRTFAQDLITCGDTDGYLRLFRYPCITPRAEFTEAKVYSGTIACVKFLYGNHSLVTVGGTDASLMIWELIEE